MKWDLDDNAHLFETAAEMRLRVFRTQAETADYFQRTRSTISKYESGWVRPPLGYLAALLLLDCEQEIKANQFNNQQAAGFRLDCIQFFNRLMSRFRLEYPGSGRLRSWSDLVRLVLRDNPHLQAAIQVGDYGLHEEYGELYHGNKEGTQIPSDQWQSEPSSETEITRASKAADVDLRLIAEEVSLSRILALFEMKLSKIRAPFLVPRLPSQGVIGREQEIVKIKDLLNLEDAQATEESPVVLQGIPGAGKSILAIKIGRTPDILNHFDGVLWADCGPEANIRSLQSTWGDMLGVDLRSEPDGQACSNRLQSLLFRKRFLLILDDVWRAEQACQLLVGGPYCRTLITTRNLNVATTLSAPSHIVSVQPLSLDDSLELLYKLVPASTPIDRITAENICKKLGGLPLAIMLVGRLLAQEAGIPSRTYRLLNDISTQREARLSLSQVEGRSGLSGEATIRAVLGMSIEQLDPTDQDRFALLSVFGGEPLTFEIGATSFVWGCSLEEAERTVSELLSRGLLQATSDDRYYLHQLLADYAEELRDTKNL
jgi:hypothetical protein